TSVTAPMTRLVSLPSRRVSGSPTWPRAFRGSRCRRCTYLGPPAVRVLPRLPTPSWPCALDRGGPPRPFAEDWDVGNGVLDPAHDEFGRKGPPRVGRPAPLSQLSPAGVRVRARQGMRSLGQKRKALRRFGGGCRGVVAGTCASALRGRHLRASGAPGSHVQSLLQREQHP